jgi:hypothetical protein
MTSNTPEQPSQIHQIIEIDRAEKWEMYHRLQELQIHCQCAGDRPLIVRCNTVNDVIQLWSVVKQISSSRQQSIEWLKLCWENS